MVEEWKYIDCKKKYLVSNTGKVKSLYRNRILIPYVNKKMKVAYVCIALNGNRGSKAIKQLVAENFMKNYDNKMVVDHKDGDITNCSLDNLYLRPKKNTRKVIRIDLETKEKKEYENITTASEENFVNMNSIILCCNGTYRTAAGYGWKYA